MPIVSPSVNTCKRRRLSSGCHSVTTRCRSGGPRSAVRKRSSPLEVSSVSAVQRMRGMDLPVKELSPEESNSFLESLDRGSRPSMEVKVQTTTCFQRFLNAGMMTQEELSNIQALAQQLGSSRNLQKSPRVLFIGATEIGGGVAEMRLDTIALFCDLNFRSQWLVMDGADQLHKVTVHILEGIQKPKSAPLELHETETFHLGTLANFLRLEQEYSLADIDVLWIDDLQPLGLAPLVKMLYPKTIVIWRCHVHLDAEPSIKSFIKDLTSGNLHPERDQLLLTFLKSRGHGSAEIPPVDLQVFHHDAFSADLEVPREKVHVMPPCINPLSFKNMALNDCLIRSTLIKYGVMPGPKAGCYSQVPPYVLKVSRFDPDKAPLELITAFRDATLSMPLQLQRDIRLVIVSSLPGDNPSGTDLSRLLQEYVDALDLGGLPADQRAGGPYDFRKRIHLLLLDDKAPWERLLERLHHLRCESGYNFDRMNKIAREVRELAPLPIPDAIASLEHCGLVSPALAERLAAEPSPIGVGFTPQQTLAMLELLEAQSIQRRDPGWTAVTRRRAEQDCLTGKEINALEVNALQSGALVTVQFSSKEGLGLTVSESLVKAVPGFEGLTVCTLVGGMRPLAETSGCFKIEYPPAEVAESLQEYAALPDKPGTQYLQSLSSRIAKRSSVGELADCIRTGAMLPEKERQRRSRAAREAVLANFSTWVNVHNILRGMLKAASSMPNLSA
mmetsp:Transcript_58694/g.107083  ORF Transcript_58694/g.107083 Transcript_58694/m.107083 type:complete len:729 (-) Transcript_58694:100-2286(-)